MLTVHIRINDETGQPLPARIRISSENHEFVPLGMPLLFPVGIQESVGPFFRIQKENWFSSSGTFEIKLPAETPIRLQALHGLSYLPLDEIFTLGPGKISARFVMSKKPEFLSTEWMSIDSRVHFESPHDLLQEAEAEGLDVVNLLIREHPCFSQDGHLYPIASNLSAFSGQTSLLQKSTHQIHVNTFNWHPSLGRLGLLHTHRPVYPLTFGEFNDDWGLCDWCDQAHRKKGLTVWCDPFQSQSGLLGGEALVALLLGKIDAFEFDPNPRQQPILPWLYRLWNAGFHVPLIAGSGKISNTMPIGAMRTYARAEERNWVEAVRAGRSFVTNGPLLKFHVNGLESGSKIESQAGETLKLHVEKQSDHNKDELQIVCNGNVLATTSDNILSLDWIVQESSWLAARVMGQHGSQLYSPMPSFAHSSSIRVDVNGKPFLNRRAYLPLLRKCVVEVQQWVDEHGRFTEEKYRKRLLDSCAQALLKLSDDTN